VIIISSYLRGRLFEFAALLDELLAGRFALVLAPGYFSRFRVHLPLKNILKNRLMGGYVFVLPHHMSTGHLDTASFEKEEESNSSFVCIRYLSRHIQMGSVDLITRSYCLFRYVFFFFFSPSDI